MLSIEIRTTCRRESSCDVNTLHNSKINQITNRRFKFLFFKFLLSFSCFFCLAFEGEGYNQRDKHGESVRD